MTIFLQELSFTKIEKHIDLTIEQLSDYKGELFFWCAGHGMSSVGDKPTTGSYRQV